MPFNFKKFFKALFRSKNLAFATSFAGISRTRSIESFRWKNLRYFYRPNTSDAFVAYECFLHGKRNAYASKFLPAPSEVKTIVDIGANVGASVFFWKNTYPLAKINCFEPIPSNFQILERNCAELHDVVAHNEALGDEDGEITFIHSPGLSNEGGWSIFQRGAIGNEEKLAVPIRKSSDRLQELGISQIDILKVDTEGAEKKIIFGLGTKLLANTKYICGELHGERDFELLDYLEQNGFHIGVRKTPKSPLFNFEAIRNS